MNNSISHPNSHVIGSNIQIEPEFRPRDMKTVYLIRDGQPIAEYGVGREALGDAQREAGIRVKRRGESYVVRVGMRFWFFYSNGETNYVNKGI